MEKEECMELGNAFECEESESRFNRPEMMHSCKHCSKELNYKNMEYKQLREYIKSNTC